MTFTPNVLHDGPDADAQLATFAPRLRGRGAAVVVGTMRVAGLLPAGFA